MAQKEVREAPASTYKHTQESVQRPDVGIEAQFAHKKAPRTYRYDSSLAPELSWDESADRALAEWLIGLMIFPQESAPDVPLRFQPCAGAFLGRERTNCKPTSTKVHGPTD